jgi:2',3'-cyclic-nucleotide 2'-phosphodiesterase (5'-nucleotidase family)
MVRAISSLNYDSWTLGNHEFDWGLDTLSQRIRESKIPVLAANLLLNPPPAVSKETVESMALVQPFVIREFEGIKVGIVGLTTPGIPSWSRPHLIPGITIEDSISCLKRVLPKMKAAGCQILILTTHQGYRENGDDHGNQIEAITRNFPELDIIIGGHSHRFFEGRHLGRTLYAQAAYWGTYLGRVDLVFDTEQNQIKSKTPSAIPMNSSIPVNETLTQALKTELENTEKTLNVKIGESVENINSLTGPKKETSAFNLICLSISEKLKALHDPVDAVIHGTLNRRAMIHPGPITMKNVFEMIPYENTIGAVTLTVKQLKEILEENANAYQSDRFRGIWGMTMHIKPSAPEGQQLTFLGDRQELSMDDDTKTIRVAFNSYDLASGGARWKKMLQIIDMPDSQLKEYDFQTRDVVAEYIQSHSPLKAELHGWWKIERSKSTKKTSEE